MAFIKTDTKRTIGLVPTSRERGRRKHLGGPFFHFFHFAIKTLFFQLGSFSAPLQGDLAT